MSKTGKGKKTQSSSETELEGIYYGNQRRDTYLQRDKELVNNFWQYLPYTLRNIISPPKCNVLPKEGNQKGKQENKRSNCKLPIICMHWCIFAKFKEMASHNDDADSANCGTNL